MSTWESATLDLNGLKIHYWRTGGQKPPLVLAHGFSDDALCWTPLAEVLAEDYDVIMVDARGHGRSDGPEGSYGSMAHAGDLAGVIEALGLERPAVLGHSMGALSTLALAVSRPELPGAILLEDPPDVWVPTELDDISVRVAGMRNWIVGVKRQTYEELVAAMREASPGWSEAELGPWAESKLRLSFNVLSATPDAPIDWATLLPTIACPALLIIGDAARGAIISMQSADSLAAMVPGLEVVHIVDAGHSIHRDQFGPYLEKVRAFLKTNYR